MKQFGYFVLGSGIAALLPVLKLSAATYYVATNGADTNSGMATNVPWRTIQHAADSVAPGDTVLVHGGTYHERVTFNISGSATDGFVAFKNYPGETPIVDGAGLSVPPLEYATGLFEFTNVSYVSIQGFEIRDYQTKKPSRVPAGIDITGAPHDLMFISNRVHNIANLSASSGANAYAIVVHGTQLQSISNLVFIGNDIYSNALGQSETFSLDGNVNGFEICGNRVHDNNNIGIGFIGYEGVCSDAGQDYARNGVCRSNVVWNISAIANPGEHHEYDADGIYSDGGSNVLIELNDVHDCDIGVELASEHKGHAAIACVCRDNLIWSNHVQGISIGGYSPNVGQTWNCFITHNTLYHNDSALSGDGELYIQYNALSNFFEDNIVVASEQNVLIGSAGFSHSTNTTAVDRNLYFAPGGTNGATWQWNKQTYASFAAYRSGTGNDLHSVFADPHLASDGNASLAMTPGETDISLRAFWLLH